jgi:hypothetical protein
MISFQYTRLPNDFDINIYTKVFHETVPIFGLERDMSLHKVISVANRTFADFCLKLSRYQLAKTIGHTWYIHRDAQRDLINMGILPIVLYSGTQVVFVDNIDDLELVFERLSKS